MDSLGHWGFPWFTLSVNHSCASNAKADQNRIENYDCFAREFISLQ